MGGARLSLLVAFLAAMVGCVERSQELTPAEREQLRPYLSRRAPRPQHPLRVSFENKVELLGYDVEPATAARGGRVRVTWYWKSNRQLDDGWQLFTHLAGDDGRNLSNADGEGMVRRLYSPSRWRPGEHVRDVQEIVVPSDLRGEHLVFFLGVWNGPARLRVTAGPHDGENRARVLALPVTGTAPAADALPRLRVVRTTGPITLDGKLDEPVWASAPPTAPFVNTMSGGPSDVPATVRAAWDDSTLYVAFEIPDPFLKSRFSHADDHLWEEDCGEIMLDPDGDGLNYFELQASPRGTVFDTRYDSRRIPQPFGHVDWNSGMRTGVERRGDLDDSLADTGYTLELALPFAGFRAGATPPENPTAGTVWRGNFYVMDARENGMAASGWSAPRVPDFHMPPRFGELVFEAAP